MASEQQGDLEQVLKASLDKVASGKIKFSDLLKQIAPEHVPDRESAPEVPLPAAITEAERQALKDLERVYGSVTPRERRRLSPAEVNSLIEERQTIDTVSKMAARRKGDIRSIVLNHIDVDIEEDEGVDHEVLDRDKDGHYIPSDKVKVGDMEADQRFSWEPRDGTPDVQLDVLERLADDPDVEWFTHRDYLDMTTQVRVFDEAKAMLLLRRKPALLEAMRQATTKSGRTASFYLRNR